MTDINDSDARPSSLRHLVGMKNIVTQVQVAIDSSFADQTKFPHTLLVSEPGLGKTELCHVIKQEMAVEMQSILGISIDHVSELNALVLSANDKDIIYIDEADGLRTDFQNALYLMIDRREVVLSHGNRSPQKIKTPDVTFLLSTNFEYSLLPALRDRMRQTLYLSWYATEELTEILRRRVHASGWAVEDGVLSYLASLSKGTPRQALRLLSASRRVTRSHGDSEITVDHAKTAVSLEGLDEKGLSIQEQTYLRALANGDSKLGVISSRIGMPPQTVQKVVEPFLIRSGLISKDQSRRELTAAGREHVSTLQK